MQRVNFNTKEEWLEARKSCLTGTTIGKYIGVESGFAQKTDAEMAKSPAVNFGKNCEESILTIFKNLPVISKQTLVQPTVGYSIWYSDIDKRIAGSLDGLAFEAGEDGFVECKSTSIGLYDLKNLIIPQTTWLQLFQYFSLDDKLKFCYLVVCDYPQWGNGAVKIDWLRISRNDVLERITNLRGWQNYILATDGRFIG